MAIEFLYFDLGNVLLSFSHERMCRQMADVAGVPAAVVWEALFEGPRAASVLWRFERGEVNALAVYEHFCERCGVRPDREAMFAAGCDMFAEIPASVKLVERLHASGRRLGILSNTNPIDWGFVSAGRFPFLNRCFEHAVLSFEARSMKPERAIYDHAVERAGVAASEVFFTDDREENVAGAIAAGLDAVLFTSAATLEKDLRDRNVV